MTDTDYDASINATAALNTSLDAFRVIAALGITASSYGLPMQNLVLTGPENLRTREARDMAIYLALTTLDLQPARVAHLFNVSKRRVQIAYKHISHERFTREVLRLDNILKWVVNMSEFSNAQVDDKGKSKIASQGNFEHFVAGSSASFLPMSN